MSTIKDFFLHAWEEVQHLFTQAEDVVGAALKAFIEDIGKGGGTVLVQSALDAVAAAEAAGGSGGDKFAAAVASVKADLESKGLPLIEHSIQAAVLAAVSKLRADEAATAGADPAAPVT